MFWAALSLIAVALALSLPLCYLLIGASTRRGRLDQPGSQPHKLHGRAVPNTGGVAIFWAIVLPLSAIVLAAWFAPVTRLPAALSFLLPHQGGLREQSPTALALLAALAVVHVLGRIDDRRTLGPYLKLGVELAVALVLAAFFDMRILHLLDRLGPAGVAASIALSVLWIAAISNAMNMLDNMDGLSAGVGAIIASLYLCATLARGQWFVAGLCALLVGALLGFLVFNFNPARLFMGDGGSLVVGLTLAVISMRTTYFDPAAEKAPGAWYGMLMPLVLLAVPLYDMTSVIVLRLSQGASPFVGDRQHFSHRLVARGLSPRLAVTVIWLCTLATGLGGVMLSFLTPWQAALVGAQCAAVLTILAILEFTPGSAAGKQ